MKSHVVSLSHIKMLFHLKLPLYIQVGLLRDKYFGDYEDLGNQTEHWVGSFSTKVKNCLIMPKLSMAKNCNLSQRKFFLMNKILKCYTI